jgi:hypothetical protein
LTFRKAAEGLNVAILLILHFAIADPMSARCAGRPERLTGERPRTALMRRARAFFEAFGSPPRIDLCNEGDLIAVDVIGGDCTIILTLCSVLSP